MLYGGVAWAELPISTSPQQVENGEIYDLGFVIDQQHGIVLVQDSGNTFVLEIAQSGLSPLNISQNFTGDFIIEQQFEFTLEIDDENIWSL